jgi:hypothetical protein
MEAENDGGKINLGIFSMRDDTSVVADAFSSFHLFIARPSDYPKDKERKTL